MCRCADFKCADAYVKMYLLICLESFILKKVLAIPQLNFTRGSIQT